MKQREIDRWVNRQARMNRLDNMPSINWALVATSLVVMGVILMIVLRVAHIL